MIKYDTNLPKSRLTYDFNKTWDTELHFIDGQGVALSFKIHVTNYQNQ